MYKIAIFASGTGSNALKIIQHFANSPIAEVALIVSNRENAGVKAHAVANKIPFNYYNKQVWHADPQVVVNDLIAEQIDLVVLAGFLLLVPNKLIEQFPDRILNIHPALLPDFGGKGMYGSHVHEAVRAAAKNESGITIHLVNEKYDEGEIIFQAKTPISATDTALVIQQKVLKLEHKYYSEVIENYLKDRITP